MHETLPTESVNQPTEQTFAVILRQLSPSLVLAFLTGAFLSIQGFGFMVFFVIVPQAVVTPFRLYGAIRRPDERQLNIGRVIVWLATIIAIYAIHHVRDAAYRKNADEIVARIDAYTTSHKKCPTTVADIGISRAEMRDKLGHDGYLCDGGRQYFFYPSSFDAFATWSYDFKTREWHYHPD